MCVVVCAVVVWLVAVWWRCGGGVGVSWRVWWGVVMVWWTSGGVVV